MNSLTALGSALSTIEELKAQLRSTKATAALKGEVKAAYIAGYNEGYEGGNCDGRFESNRDKFREMAEQSFIDYTDLSIDPLAQVKHDAITTLTSLTAKL